MFFIVLFNYIECIIKKPRISVLAKFIWIIASNVEHLIFMGFLEKLYPLVVNAIMRIFISHVDVFN